MGCRGCGKKGVAAIARAGAEIVLGAPTQAAERAMDEIGIEREKRPQYLETQCRGCGEIIRQSFAALQRNPDSKRKRFCSKSCEKEHADATPAG